MTNWAKMVEVIPEGERGNVKVQHFTVSEEASRFSNVRASISSFRGEYVEPGRYARLIVDGKVMMSDTLMEKSTNSLAVHQANGDVLIAGMGLGVMLIPVCQKPEVRSVTVVEKSADVIALVEPHVRAYLGEDAKKLTVIEADIFQFPLKKGQKWDTLWFDVWADICESNLDEVTTLKRKFARRLNRENPKCWVQAWQEEYLRYLRRQSKRQEKERAYWRNPLSPLAGELPKEVDGVKLEDDQ